jgi:CBS domain-containing protein
MIERWLYTHQTLRGDVNAFVRRLREQPGAVLRAALGLPEDQPRRDGAFVLPVLMTEGALALAGVVGTPGEPGRRVRVPLSWVPGPEGGFSTMEGTLELEPAGGDTGELALFGRCSIPDEITNWLPILETTEQTMRRIVRGVANELSRFGGTDTREIGRAETPLRVRDLMTPDPVVLHDDLALPTAAQVLLHYGIGGAPVVTGDQRLIGVFSESDLLAREAAPRVRTGWGAREEARRRHATNVGEACSRPAVTVPPDMSLREAARILHDRDVSRVVVVEEEQVTGILTRHDVLRALTRSARQLQEAVDVRLQAPGLGDIRATVDASGRVLLTGSTPDQRTVDDAEHAVMAVDGVAEVINEVRPRPTGRASPAR